ncbi:xylan 1,4-beta-xylosidase [Rhodococcus sp. WS4]|nr:xylan 1,4-beta-xylosidase [Rhodococcus sp. WS4]
MCLWSPGLPASDGRGDTQWPGWGFTHTQFSADDGDSAAVATAAGAIESVPMVQAQAIMGWGVDNPEPSPGQYDFRSLDRRMDFILRSGGIPVIVLCCAPDWMKGGEPGETDWDRLEDAPRPEHFADFAALSAAVAERYPYVRHFLVWNEFKGFFDDELGRWDAQGYTALYNLVYDAVKAVNPASRVGGPYIEFASKPLGSPGTSPQLQGPWGAVDQRYIDAFVYWNQRRKGVDFVAVDAHATTAQGAPDEFTAVRKFAAVTAWLRAQVDVPIWWTEWYVEPAGSRWSSEHQVALRVAAMIELASSGADTVLYWNPRPQGAECAECLWTDTWKTDGGQPLLFLGVLQRFVRWFPPNVERRKVHVADGLLALASERGRVIVNTTDTRISASVDGRQIEWSAYETRWVTASGAWSGAAELVAMPQCAMVGDHQRRRTSPPV